MNHRVAPPGTAKGRRAWLFMSILLPALASKVSTQHPLIGPDEESYPLTPHEPSSPYLLFVPPPPLRFEDPAPPPDLSVHPAAGAPPKPAVQEAMVRTARKGSTSASAPPAGAAAATIVPTSASAPAAIKSGDVTMPKPPSSPSILPDDVPAAVHPEDFLPYFQFPGAQAGGASVPSTSVRPLSTATYTQQQ